MNRLTRSIVIILTLTLILSTMPISSFAVTANVAIDEKNFPDTTFRSYILENCDLDANGILSDEESSKITSLELTSMGISDITGIEFFKSLKWLDCGWNEIEVVNCLPTTLTYVSFHMNNLTELPNLHEGLSTLECAFNDLSFLPELPTTLENLDCRYNEISELPQLPAGLKDLNCGGNLIEELPSLPNNLEELNIDETEVKIIPKLPERLSHFSCCGLELDELPEMPPTISRLDISNNQISSLTGLPENLRSLWCSNNRISELVSLPLKLKELDCSNNMLSGTLDMTTYKYMTRLECNNNSITEIILDQKTNPEEDSFFYRLNASQNYIKSTEDIIGQSIDWNNDLFTFWPQKISSEESGILSYSGIYDGNEHSFSVSNLPEGMIAYYYTAGEWTEEKPMFKNVGEHTVEYKLQKDGLDYYVGETKVTILPKDISNMEVLGLEESYVYKACPIFPSVYIEGLTAGVGWNDYKIKFRNNKDVGTATVIITGTQNYTGQLIKSFEIVERTAENDIIVDVSENELVEWFNKLEMVFNEEFDENECASPSNIKFWLGAYGPLSYYYDEDKHCNYISFKEYMDLVDYYFVNYNEPEILQYFIDYGWYEESTGMLLIGGGWGGPHDRKFLKLEKEGNSYSLYGLTFNWAGANEEDITSDMEEFYDYFRMPDSTINEKWLLRDSVKFTLKNTTTGLKILSFEKLPYYQHEGNYYFKNQSTGKFDQSFKVSLSETNYSYTGKQIIPKVVVTDRYGEVLSEDAYSIKAVSDCINKGEHSAEIVFKGDYSGTLCITFNISECNHKYGSWEIIKQATCADTGSKYKICTECGDKVTEKIQATGKHVWDEDYTIDKKATMNGNGSKSIHCSACNATKNKTEISMISSLKLSYTKTVYSGSAKKPTVTVKDSNDNALINGTDYIVTYASGRTEVGRYKLNVTFKGEYSGSKVIYFTIVPEAPSSASAYLTSYYGQYAGYDDVKFSWSQVPGASGYYVYFKKSTSDSYAYLTKTTNTYVRKKDLTDGTKYIFKVVPYYKSGDTYYTSLSYKTASVYTLKKTTAPTVMKSGTKVKVSWKNINGESGYQISQSTKKSGTNIVATYKTTTGTYKKISATKGKTYYYKVRAYKVINNKKIYGPWSSIKKYKR